MIPFFKNFKSWSARKKFFFFAGIAILCLLFLPSPALAWEVIRRAILSVPIVIISVFLLVAIAATSGIAFLMGGVLDWVISPGFVSLSYTNPCPPLPPPGSNCNPIIGLGLNITQSFVNMILVVILVYIALSIALRIGETDAKKIFAKLIVIALLVNFAPVIVGLIVDASNITMNTFLQPLIGGASAVLTQSISFVDSVKAFVTQSSGTIHQAIGVLALGAATIFLNLSIAFAFFLFAGIFIFRYIAIWVLVILSPLAFAFWILPATKKLWDMWWNNLIQWSIIGIPIAFFLYLGLSSFSAISDAFKSDLEGIPIMGTSEIGIFNQLFPFFVVVIFLVLGFIIGLSTSAMGASAIIKGGKAAGKVAGLKGASAGWRATKATGRGLRGAGSQIMGRYATEKAAGRGPFGAFSHAVAGATGQAASQAGAGIAGWASVRHRYRYHRALGAGRIKAAWDTPPVQTLRAGTRATGSVLRDMGAAYYKAAFGAPKKGKAKAFCSTCGAAAPSGATFCPSCGATT